MKRALLGGSILVFLTCAAGLAQAKTVTREALHWTGKLPAGQTMRLRNVNGSITIQAAAGDTAEVVATESKRDGDTAQVTVQVVTAKDGLVFCVFYPGKPGRCDPDGGYDAGGGEDRDRNHDHDHDDDHGNSLSADLVIKLPKGVLVDATTVNGELSVRGATAQVRAVTVNGAVEVDTTGGPVKAETVNGEVRARAGSGDVKLKTVNGSIRVTVPASLDAEVRADVVHGSIDNDFGLRTDEGDSNWGPRSLRGKVG
jgi:hypothetical protein